MSAASASGASAGARSPAGDTVIKTNYDTGESSQPLRLTSLFTFDGLKRLPAQRAPPWAISWRCRGLRICPWATRSATRRSWNALPFVSITEPTVTMTFSVNNSPFAGREGKFVTSRQLRARLDKELQTDVSLRVNDTGSPDAFEVRGRGELHLSILIETMRRQGYEFQVSKPQVIYKEIDGQTCEPIERMVADVPQAYAGAVIEKIGRRRGVMAGMHGASRVRLEFLVPSRGLFGYRSEFMTDTRGEGIMSSVFEDVTSPKRAISRTAAWARWSALKPARPPATGCFRRRNAARCSSPRRPRSTRA